MRRRIHPLAVIVFIATVAAAVALAFFVKDRIPYDLRQWDDLIFWAVIIVVGGIGALLSGKLFGRR